MRIGRPPLSPDKKGVQLNVRLPAAAHEIINKEAKALGIPSATYVKKLVMKSLAEKLIGKWDD